MDTLTLTQLILACTLVGDIGLLLLVLRERRSVKKLLFTVFLLGITGWTSAIFINLWAHSQAVEMFVFGFAAVFLTAQVLFAQMFPGRPLPSFLPSLSISAGPASLMQALSVYWSLCIGTFFLVISFWNGAVFSSLVFSPRGYTVVENGFLSEYYSFFALAFVALPIFILLRTRMHSNDPSFRSQLKYLIIGFSVFLGVNILTNSILPVFFHIFFFNAIGPVFSLVLAGFVFYIIWRYEFLDIHALRDLLDKERIYARELEMRVRERTQHIEEMRVRERQLMQDIAHAQQTSLTILRADLERLKQHRSYDDTASILQAMEQGVERSSSLTYDLLRVAQLEMQTRHSQEVVDLSALARKVVEYVDIICSANGISLTSRIESDMHMEGDEKQLEELFLTLLSNAVKYRKPHVRGSVTLSLAREAGAIVLSVADTGIGIAKEHLPHVFERFYRVHAGGDGNGLGLAIAKAIAQAHGGTIGAESAEGTGSKFTVRFKKDSGSKTA